MLKTKKIVKLSNLINDCVVMMQQAGNLAQQTHLESAFAGARASRQQKIEEADYLIRQTYMHNLSQLFPGIQIICEGEKPVREVYFA